jgi:type I restriction enzyme, S subunit
MDLGQSRLSRCGRGAEVTSGKSRFCRGDVLYGKLRPYLNKAVLPDFEGICSTDILVVRPRGNETSSEFLVHLLHTEGFLEHAVKTTSGVNHPRTSWSALSEYCVALPPLPEQRAIVRALRAVQDARDARRRELEAERERMAALMEDLFTCGARQETRKETETGKLPVGWQVRRLGDVGEVAYGLTVNQARRQSKRTAPYLTVANVTRGRLRLHEVKEIGITDSDADRFRLQRGDVLLVEGNGNPQLLGSAAMWSDEIPFALHQNHLIRARLNNAIAFPHWVMYYLNSESGRVQLLGRAKTSSGLHSINSRIVSSLGIPCPCLDEQRDIIDVLTACDEKIDALEAEAALHDELFRALLDELMTGRLSASPLAENREECDESGD